MRWGLPIILLVQCTPKFELSANVQLTCGEGCPEKLVCQDRTGFCVTELDNAPPRSGTGTATSPTTFSFGFNERVDPEHSTVTIPSLVVESLETIDDGLTLIVTTSVQRPAASYKVHLEVRDLQANVLVIDRPTLGFGGEPDRSPPAQIAPPDKGRMVLATGDMTTLRWAATVGASSYQVRVATDAAMTDIVSETSLPPETTELAFLPPDDRTYYWRVAADVSEGTGKSTRPPFRFSVLRGTVHVFCPAGEACEATDEEQGDQSFPLRSIRRALTLAQTLGLSRVEVADRGEPYAEAIVIASPLTLDGGGSTLSAPARAITVGEVSGSVSITNLHIAGSIEGLRVEGGPALELTLSSLAVTASWRGLSLISAQSARLTSNTFSAPEAVFNAGVPVLP